MLKLLLVMVGGAIGAVSRFLLANIVSERYATVFPLGTFIINVTGSFLIGVLMMLFLNRSGFNANWRLFLVTGILGGYTTFSSFEWETFAVMRGGATLMALVYVASSVILGLGAVWLGALMSNRLWPR
jgi:fluoride exporter